LGGANGGIDLILQRDGRTTLVQCKQWRNRKVNARTVREQFGLLTHHGADAVIIASVGEFTSDAHAFVQDKPIVLLNGSGLVELIDSVGAGPASDARPATAEPAPQPTRPAGDAHPDPAIACPRCKTPAI